MSFDIRSLAHYHNLKKVLDGKLNCYIRKIKLKIISENIKN